MITYSGKRVFPPNHADHCADTPSIEDIAIGLSRQSRFGGQTREFYTVFSHVMVGSEIYCEEPIHKLDVLLHDSCEAVISDVPTTWKPESLNRMEFELLTKIYDALGVGQMGPEAEEWVKKVDFALLVAEAHVLGHRQAEGYWPIDSFHGDMADMISMCMELTRREVQNRMPIYYLTRPEQACTAFRNRFEQLVGAIT